VATLRRRPIVSKSACVRTTGGWGGKGIGVACMHAGSSAMMQVSGESAMRGVKGRMLRVWAAATPPYRISGVAPSAIISVVAVAKCGKGIEGNPKQDKQNGDGHRRTASRFSHTPACRTHTLVHGNLCAKGLHKEAATVK
jgi:hypothetical protein